MPDPGCPGGTHPLLPFSSPRSVATDSYGNIYVASYGGNAAEGAEGRIDIFDSEGFFITELDDEFGPLSVAVDSAGYLYVFNNRPGNLTRLPLEEVVRYAPTQYVGATGEIAYEDPPQPVVKGVGAGFVALAVNRLNDHLFVNQGTSIWEFSSGATGNTLINDSIGAGVTSFQFGLGLAVDAEHGLIYASTGHESASGKFIGEIKVLELAEPHALVRTIDGSDTPAGQFTVFISLAVDEGTGHLFVYNGEGDNKIYELTEDGQYVSTIEHDIEGAFGAEIAVDNGVNSPNGALDPNGRYLFAPSGASNGGHVFAFGPAPPVHPPEVEEVSFDEVSEVEARLQGTINPGGLDTTYTFQYTTQASFEASGFDGAATAGSGQIPAGSADVEVSARATGLQPGTAYRFRLVATNSQGEDEEQGGFSSYPATIGFPPCPNDALRIGLSALLPDCRAYELVTPADTNARSPLGVGFFGTYFATREASPDGTKVSFQIEGGSLPGIDATGSLAGDPYLASRGPSGWTTALAGPDGTESPSMVPGSTSPDQGYSFWSTGSPEGSASVGGSQTTYVRYPDGHSALIGRGSLATDPHVEGKLISENGGHIIFRTTTDHHTPIKLEPNAPPTGTAAIYDRTADEVTHVVSLLPGDETPAAGQDAEYVGASLDGRGVAFEIGDTLYLRYENQETFEVGDGVAFAGIAEGGARIFYLEAGKLLRFDAQSGKTTPFNASGTVTPVNVSADGSAAYFVSPNVLTSQLNPVGAKAKSGEENLFLSREGTISFVGTVTKRDVEGENNGNGRFDGLGLWTQIVGSGQFGKDPSRSTPDGSVMLFQSRAPLTGYASEENPEVYRYSEAGSLTCLSCNPTGAPASGAASLQSTGMVKGTSNPFGPYAFVANVRADGRRAFFQSTEALVAGDTDGLQDVYEWEDQGVGSCTRAGGCVYLISSGHSAHADHLYAVSDSGDDVFFRTGDLLLPSDQDATPSIYDARVGGGFPEPASGECQGEGCRTTLAPPPALAPARTPVLGGQENAAHRCPKGKRRVKRHGKVRCVKKHRHHHRKAGTKKKGAGR